MYKYYRDTSENEVKTDSVQAPVSVNSFIDKSCMDSIINKSCNRRTWGSSMLAQDTKNNQGGEPSISYTSPLNLFWTALHLAEFQRYGIPVSVNVSDVKMFFADAILFRAPNESFAMSIGCRLKSAKYSSYIAACIAVVPVDLNDRVCVASLQKCIGDKLQTAFEDRRYVLVATTTDQIEFPENYGVRMRQIDRPELWKHANKAIRAYCDDSRVKPDIEGIPSSLANDIALMLNSWIDSKLVCSIH